MKKKIIWGIVMGLVVAGAIYLILYPKGNTCLQFCPGMTDTDRYNIEKSALEAETAHWKTYINIKYGFEFKYPGFWRPCDKNVGIEEEDGQLSFLCIYDPSYIDEIGAGPAKISFVIDKNMFIKYPDYFSLQTYLKDGHDNTLKFGIFSALEEGEIPFRSETDILKYISIGSAHLGTSDTFFVFLPSNLLAIRESNSIPFVKAILSTFKFTK